MSILKTKYFSSSSSVNMWLFSITPKYIWH